MDLEAPRPIAGQHPSWRATHPVLWLGVLTPLALVMVALLTITWPVPAAGSSDALDMPVPLLRAPNATPVGGSISVSTTWTLANSPYIVTPSVVVENQAVLTIEAGVVISFHESTGLYIGDDAGTPGRLVAAGNASNRITFTAYSPAGSPTRGFWNGIEFAGNSPTNTLAHCLIEYAGTGVTSGDSDSHVIDRCTFRYNGDDGSETTGGAINLDGDGVTITANRMYDNELGIRLRKSNYNTIARNRIYNNDRFGIRFIVELGSGGSRNQILDNHIYNNGSAGLYLDEGSWNDVQRNLVYNNGGHGVRAESQTTLQFTENIVRANGQNGFTCADCNSFPVAFHSNVLCSNSDYDIENLSASALTAQGNWFGTNTPTMGAEVSGNVDFTPAISMSLNAAPAILPADGTSTAVLTLTMLGGGHAVPDGYQVMVTASEGSVLPAVLSLTGGQATTDYTAGTVPGAVVLEATDHCTSLLFTEVLTLQAFLDLAVIKDDGVGLATVLQPQKAHVISYTFTYSNEGTADATGIVLTDALPAGSQVYASNGWSCTDDTCTYPISSLPAGAQQTAPPLVVEALECGDLRNEVSIGPISSDYDPHDNTFAVTTSVPCLPDLAVVKNDNVEPVARQQTDWLLDLMVPSPLQADPLPCVEVGERITYTILYLNSGPGTATSVTLTETVPENTHYVGSGWACSGGICTLDLGSLAPGDAGEAFFVVEVDTVPPDLLVTNEARIGSAEEDLYPPDNVSRDHTHICEPVGACLQVSKDDNLPCAFPGDEIRYTITFSNTCDWNVSGVVLTETVPISTTYLTSPGWLSIGSDQYAYYHGLLPAHMTGTVEFVVLVDNPLPDSVTETVNQVCVGREGLVGPEDCDSIITPLPLMADLRVVKHDHIGPPPPVSTLQQLDRFYQLLYDQPYQETGIGQLWEPVRPGDVFSYTITYANMGRVPASGVVLTDTLPDHTTYVGYGWTQQSGDTYLWTIGDLDVGEVGQRNLWVRVGPVPCPEEYLYNWAYIAGNEEECNLANNWSGEETPVECSGLYQSYLPIILRGYAPPPPPPPPPEDAYVSDVAVNPDTNRVYVASPLLDAVFAVDPTGGLPGDDYIVATIGVGDHPLGLAVVSTTNKVYAANLRSNNVTAIDGSTHSPITNIPVGVEPCKVAADSGAQQVYVTNHGERFFNGAAAINSLDDTFIHYYRLNGTSGNYGIDVDPVGEKLFVASRDGGLIAIQEVYSPTVDPLIIKLDPPRVPFVVAFNPATNHLLVTAADDNLVVVLDPYSIQLDQGSWITWQGRQVFVLNRTNAGWITEVPVGDGAEEGIAVNPLTGYVYVTNAEDDTLSILTDDANPANIQWVMDLAVGDYPQGVDVDVTRNLIYVGNAESRDLTVVQFDGVDHTVLMTIPLN